MAQVADKTGLTGRYDFTLEYAGVYYPGGAFPAPREDGQPGHAATMMDVLVVDRVDKIPTEN